MTESPFKAKLI